MRLSPSAPSRTANAWAAAAAASLLFAIALATAPIATADTCDNATLRAQNNSTALPDCRAYEMVSSPYKEGFDIIPFWTRFTDDGTVSYKSVGSFAGNQTSSVSNTYHADRSAAGWTTTAPGPPEVLYSTGTTPPTAESPDLRWTLWTMIRRDLPVSQGHYWRQDSDGAFARIDSAEAPGTVFGGASDDFSHTVLYGADEIAVFEYVGTGNGGPPRAVNVDNDGQSLGRTGVRDVSGDGRVIVLTASSTGVSQVVARVAGSATVAVSGSECTRAADDPGGLCNEASPAAYVGGADDGSRVFFTTSQQLVNGDTDTGNDLYACDIPSGTPTPVGTMNPCASLTEVSGAADDAQVENVAAISEDGSRAYFVAAGAVSADNLGVKDVAAVAGQPNLYVWTKDAEHPAGQVRFVAGLAASDITGGQLTPDNRYLLFTTASGLVTGGPGADTDGVGVRDAYRYDASSHSIVRVSTSVSGGGGNAPGFDVSIDSESMSADGSTVIFDTAEALSLSDTNGATDVYSWRDGQVSLISAGGGNSAGVSSSGRDIFFTTDAQVIAADGDPNTDIYTARVGGGFDPPRLPASCSGDGCQGLLSGAPGLSGPQSGLPGDSDPDVAAAVLSLRAVTAAQRRRLAATGKLALTVAANTAGRVSATARAKIGGRLITVGSARRTMTTPGSMAVTLKLSRKARAQLARRGRLTVKVVVSHSKATRGRSVTLKLTRARAKSSSVGGRS